jgi:hypothetical protein
MTRTAAKVLLIVSAILLLVAQVQCVLADADSIQAVARELKT